MNRTALFLRSLGDQLRDARAREVYVCQVTLASGHSFRDSIDARTGADAIRGMMRRHATAVEVLLLPRGGQP